MSLIQSIIGSVVGASAPPPAWYYPPIGNHYPVITGISNGFTPAITVSGYYDQSSLSGAPNLGLWRKTYVGTAFDSNFGVDSNFPGSYTLAETTADPYVGFGNDSDVNVNFTMEWLGYFKPAQSGDFVFRMYVDDFAMAWIGSDAVSGFATNNTILQANNNDWPSNVVTLTAGRYYPVRIRYVENTGGHNCTIWTALNNTVGLNNAESGATGQFFYDGNTAGGAFPSGLIV